MLICLFNKLLKHEHISIQQQLLLLVNNMVATSQNQCHCWGTKAELLFMQMVRKWLTCRLVESLRVTTVIWAGLLAGSHLTETENGTRRTHLTASLSRGAASFTLHLICEFGQLPEQVQAEYTPLAYSQGPRHQTGFSSWAKLLSTRHVSHRRAAWASLQTCTLEGIFLTICQLN